MVTMGQRQLQSQSYPVSGLNSAARSVLDILKTFQERILS